ncbi:MAG: ATP-binding protein, partial [Ferruginibacter sp.]
IHSTTNACYGSIWKYKDYIFWGSYGFGFFVYKNGVIKEMPVDKNEFLLYCHCFVLDDLGFCWISTNRGLFKVKIDEIIAHFENGTTPIYYHYFGKKDGIEMTELNGGCTPCALELKDKTLSFPTMDGLLWVNPLTAKPLLPEGNIYVDEILIDNKNINPDSLNHIKLPSAVKDILIKLGYSAWCNKENIYIDYQLNDTTNWKKLNATDNAFIQFSNLPAGKYKLRLRKLNGFGIGNYSYKTVEFTIEKQWYNQWWFYLLIFGAVTALIFLIAKIRTRQFVLREKKLEHQVAEKTNELQQKNEVLEKNNSINTRLISIISHDIITPLKFLNVAGKNLLEKKTLMNEDLKDETIKEITSTSKELQLLSTNILNWIKYQNENRRLAKEEFVVHDMINQIFSVLNSMAHQKKLNLVNQVNSNIRINQYFEPLKILIYNLVTNAIHFSEKGSIVIDTAMTDEKTIISVTDEGSGMTQDQIKNIMADQFIISSANVDNKKGNGLGYLIIKDLLKMMNAKLSIESEKGKGTKVFVELPK